MSKLDRFRDMTPADKDNVWQEIMDACELVADCWIYPGTNSSGYGMKYIAGKMMTTSRFTLCYVTRESLNRKGDACHIGDCPYRACCNPRHLAWGTHAENAGQREQKRRLDRESLYLLPPVAMGHVTHVKRTQDSGAYSVQSEIRAHLTDTGQVSSDARASARA